MRNFSARETEWLLELDGIELAGFRRRAFAFIIDSAITSTVLGILGGFVSLGVYLTNILFGHALAPHIHKLAGNEEHPHHIFRDIIVPVLYFGILTWKGRGRSPGKYFMKIRVVSLVHRHLSLWHSIERALGYGAAALEGGFGFFQFFIHPYRRCVQDRIAETIVVTEAGYQAMQHKLSHPLLPDDGHQPPARLADELPSPPQGFISPSA
jgi:uncharacterized RDD family membrane protein YckC